MGLFFDAAPQVMHWRQQCFEADRSHGSQPPLLTRQRQHVNTATACSIYVHFSCAHNLQSLNPFPSTQFVPARCRLHAAAPLTLARPLVRVHVCLRNRHNLCTRHMRNSRYEF